MLYQFVMFFETQCILEVFAMGARRHGEGGGLVPLEML